MKWKDMLYEKRQKLKGKEMGLQSNKKKKEKKLPVVNGSVTKK